MRVKGFNGFGLMVMDPIRKKERMIVKERRGELEGGQGAGLAGRPGAATAA